MTPAELKQARENANLTQEQAALKLGIGTSTLRFWESLETLTERQQISLDARFAKVRKEFGPRIEAGEGK